MSLHCNTTPARPRFLPWAPLLTLAIMVGPVAAGVLGTLAPAFGYMPALGGDRITLNAFVMLFDWPGITRASTLSITTGIASTALSLLLVALICAAWSGSRAFRIIDLRCQPGFRMDLTQDLRDRCALKNHLILNLQRGHAPGG